MKQIVFIISVLAFFGCKATKSTSNNDPCHYVKTCQDEYILVCPDTTNYLKTYQDSVTWGYLPDTNTYYVFGDTLLDYEDFIVRMNMLEKSLDSLHNTWNKN